MAASTSTDPVSPFRYGALRHEDEEFVRAILEKDMKANPDERLEAQRGEYGSFLRAPLPLDTASNTSGGLPHPIYQLVESVSTTEADLRHNIHQTLSRDDQPQRVVVAAAAKGVGKTHAAFAVGRSHAPVVMIRAAQACSDGDRPSLTEPFDWLHSYLDPMDAAVRHVDDAEQRCRVADCAQSLLEVVLLAHVLVAVDVVECAISSREELTHVALRELLLRFGRNGRGEMIVRRRCEFLAASIAVHATASQPWFPSEWRAALRERLCESVKEWMPKLREPGSKAPLLVVWDEASALRGRWKHVFVSEREFTEIRAGAHSTSMTPRRDGLYAALNVACKYAAYGWAQFMTGTALDINVHIDNASKDSPVRRSALVAPPRALLSPADMQRLLQFYFSIPSAVFDNGVIQGQLAKVRGRPLFFMQAVFEPLVMATLAGETRGWEECTPSQLESKLVALWTLPIEQLMQERKLACERLLTMGESVVRSLSDGTTRALLQPIVNHVLAGSTVLTLRKKSLHHIAVVDYGIAPEGARTPRSMAADADDIEYDLSLEPATLAAVQDVVVTVAKDATMESKFLAQLLPSDGNGTDHDLKGRLAEQVLAYDFCLRVFACVCKATDAGSAKAYMPLADLVRPLCDSRYANELHPLETRAHMLTKLEPTAKESNVLQRFINADNTINEELFLVGLPHVMGIDVAFIASDQNTPAERRRYRLVCLQVNNKADGTLWEAAQTLAPGFQFLDEKARMAVAQFALDGHVSAMQAADVRASVSKALQEFLKWANGLEENLRFLRTDWIRLACVARGAHKDIQRVLLRLAEWEDLLPKPLEAQVILSDEQENVARRSPLLLLHLASKRWLLSGVRNLFIDTTDSQIGWPREPRYLVAAMVPPSCDVAERCRATAMLADEPAAVALADRSSSVTEPALAEPVRATAAKQ